MEKSTTSCVFLHPEHKKDDPCRVVFAGLFPPARAEPGKQHNNATSQAVIAVLGSNIFDWVDLSIESPDQYAYHMDTNDILENISPLFDSWISRIFIRCNQLQQSKKVVYICGEICQYAFDLYIDPKKCTVLSSSPLLSVILLY